MKIIFALFVIGLVSWNALSSDGWHHDISRRNIFQKVQPTFLKTRDSIFEADYGYSISEVRVALQKSPFRWSEPKANYFIDTYRKFACSPEMLKQDEAERRVLANNFIHSHGEVRDYFPFQEDQRAVAYIFTGCTENFSDQIQFSSVGIVGLSILANLNLFRSRSDFQALNSDEIYQLTDNYVQNLSAVWDGLELNRLDKQFIYHEIVDKLYESVPTENDAYWADIDLGSVELNKEQVYAEKARLLVNPESAYEHSKRNEVGGSDESHRFFFTIGFFVIRDSFSKYCALPIIGQSQSKNAMQILYVGEANENIFEALPKEGRTLSKKLLKVESSLEAYPEIYIAIPRDLDRGCKWVSHFDTEPAVEKSTFVNGARYFQAYKMRNPLKEAYPRFALQIHQLPLFRRGLWQNCPHAEEKLWSFFSASNEGAGYPFVGGQVYLEPQVGDPSAYMIFKYLDAVLRIENLPPLLGDDIPSSLVMDVRFAFRSKSRQVHINLTPVDSEVDLTDPSMRSFIVNQLSSTK